MFAFNILSVASIHNVVRSPFYLCGPFTRKDQMEFIAMVKVKRDHVTGRHFVNVAITCLLETPVKSALTSGITFFPAKPG
jgi:hypothetical protein